MSAVVYDAAVLIAAERNDRERWADHRVRLEAGIPPAVPATVVAQVSRTPQQVQLRRFLRGCEVVALDEGGAHRAGALLAAAKMADVVDASVIDLAIRRRAEVLTGDPKDLRRLAAAAGVEVEIVRV